MKTQDVIYKILEKLDETLDENNPDFTDLSPESLGISKERRNYILEMMQDAGLIKGVNFVNGGRNRAAFLLKGTKYSKRTLLLPERSFTDDGRTGSHRTA